MKVKLLVVGKTDGKSLIQLISNYENRLKHYVKFELEFITDLKNVQNLSESQQKEKEGQAIIKKLSPSDVLVLLDERGKTYTSVEFSDFLQKKMNSGIKQLIFTVGGPYGFSEAVYQRAEGMISLSKMTFSHQMVRLFFIEQVYRAFTILRNEPYHHR